MYQPDYTVLNFTLAMQAAPRAYQLGDVKSFFDKDMSNEVVRIHSSQACIIDSFLEKLSVCLAVVGSKRRLCASTDSTSVLI